MSIDAGQTAEPCRRPKLPSRYTIRRHIATGGMATVWCAQDRLLGRDVAIKVLSQQFAGDELAIRRFKREARTAARVSAHPHVVTIFDVGDIDPDSPDASPSAFIVMEYLAGGTVADAMCCRRIRRAQALRWLHHAASALDHAHEREIVHRDVKPANLLLDGERSLHVADFGIARLQSEDTVNSGELVGTAAYLAPEQALGREATSASDCYALAVVAFELLTGRRPFTGSQFAAQARQHIEDQPPAASACDATLPPAVDEVLWRGMAKHPTDRYRTAGMFVDVLDAALPSDQTATTRTLAKPVRGAGTTGAGVLAGRENTPSTAIASAGGASGGRPRRARHAVVLASLAVMAVGLMALITQLHRGPSGQTGATSASALQVQGRDDMLAHKFPAAIATLQQALAAASPRSLTHAYAQYDLGRSLVLSGRPAQAVPILERLRIPNQTSLVRQMLDRARAAASSASQTGARTDDESSGDDQGQDQGSGDDDNGGGGDDD